jgi:hypothetical protein
MPNRACSTDAEVDRPPLLHQSGRGTPPDEAVSGGNDSLYCFNFLTQRGRRRPIQNNSGRPQGLARHSASG